MNDHDNREAQNADEPSQPDTTRTEETLILKPGAARPHLLTSGEDHLVAFADGGFARLTEVMTLLRDPADGRLVVHINGYAYRSLGHHPAVKKHFTALMKELSGSIMQPAPPRPVTDLPQGLETPYPAVSPSEEVRGPNTVGPDRIGPDTVGPDRIGPDTPPEPTLDGDTLILHTSDRQTPPPADEDVSTQTDVLPIAPPEPDDLEAPELEDLLMPDLVDLIYAKDEPPASPPDEDFVPPEERPDVPPPRPDGLPGDLPDFKSYAEPASEKKGLFGRRRVEYNTVPELNIAGAIETFLQHKLERLPEWQSYGLHVHPARDGTLRIEVKGKFYQAISDIQDEQVRNFLAETIQEWQDRQ